MNDFELTITNVTGWAPGTRLYRRGEEYWLISVIDLYTVRNAVAESVGIVLPEVEEIKPGLKGHVEIYRATCESADLYNWVPDDPDLTPPPDGAAVTTTEDGDTLTILVDGEVHATAHREFDRRVYEVAAIDADGDPLNGLTPQWVLPHGTSFADALAHIIAESNDDTTMTEGL